MEDRRETHSPRVSATLASALNAATWAPTLACAITIAPVVSNPCTTILEVNNAAVNQAYGAAYFILEWARRRVDRLRIRADSETPPNSPPPRWKRAAPSPQEGAKKHPKAQDDGQPRGPAFGGPGVPRAEVRAIQDAPSEPFTSNEQPARLTATARGPEYRRFGEKEILRRIKPALTRTPGRANKSCSPGTSTNQDNARWD